MLSAPRRSNRDCPQELGTKLNVTLLVKGLSYLSDSRWPVPRQVTLCRDQFLLARFWLSLCKCHKPRLSAMAHQRRSYLPPRTAASTACRPAWFHLLSCRLGCNRRNAPSVSMARCAALAILGRTARYFCPYRFSIRSTTTEAILLPPIRTFLTAVLQIPRRHSSRPQTTEATMNCVPPICKARATP